MVFAGTANAGQVTGSINTVAFDPQNITPGSRTIYTIASERDNAANQTPASGFVAALRLSNPSTIATGAPAQTYQVTFTVAGGTIPTGTAAGLTVEQAPTVTGSGSTPGSFSVVQGSRDANSITFIVTVNAPTVASSNVTGFTLTGVLANSAAEASVTLATSTSVLAGGVASVIDTTSAQTIVRYASAVGTMSVTSNNAVAMLPDFKLFGAGVTPAAVISNGGRTAVIASNFVFAASTTNNSGGVFYAGLASNAAISAAAIVNGATIGFAGSIPANMTVALSGITALPATNANSAVFTLGDTDADLFIDGTRNVVLEQPVSAALQNAIPAGFYTTTFLPTYASGYSGTAPAATTVNSGTVSLDGVNFIAPWIAGPQSGQQTVIRLSNGSSNASGGVTLRLLSSQARAPGVTTGPGAAISNQTCSTSFTIPANGELQITGATLTTCFGQFLRGDLQISIQSSSTALTAKARNVDASGDVFEQTLGRFSGSPSTNANF